MSAHEAGVPPAQGSRKASVACPFCSTLNRVDLARLGDRPKCGACGRPILLDRPLAVSDATFARVIADAEVPLLVDFYADWCGPCTVLERRLERYMTAHRDIALRRVNIGKWNNAAARQATSLGATALPYVRVYAPNGKFAAAVTGAMWDEILDALEKAK